MTRDVAALVASLTLDEKASITAGADLWTTVPIERVGIPAWQVTDGPNGARGAALTGTSTSACVPCGSGLGSTWDIDLIEAVGALIGQQARSKSCRVLLAPTVNLHRSPLGGRTFESYGEDPLLVGRLAAAFVRGVQSEGVATTVKHFAGNEAEFERYTINSVVDERSLRELYLMPFEVAVREAGALGIMTSYNRLNGQYCSEHVELLAEILRAEWGFEGFVVSDWFGAASSVDSPRAGLDLEMPGPGRAYGAVLADAARAGDVDEADLDAIVTRLLTVFDGLGAFDDPPFTDETVDRPEDRALIRRATTSSMVLLRNEGVVPFAMADVRTLAVIGPNADRAQIMGGGSSSLRPHYRISPLDAFRARFASAVEIVYEQGCSIDRTVPPIGPERLVGPTGAPGLALEFFAGHEHAGEPVFTRDGDSTSLMFFGAPDPSVPVEAFSVRARGTFIPRVGGPYDFTLVQAGRARLLLDGEVVLDGVTDPPPLGDAFFGQGSEQMSAVVELVEDQPVDVVMELSNEGSVTLAGVTVGARLAPSDDLIDRAEGAARSSDVVVLVVGTNDDWETEGHDRDTLDLPGDQDELVRRVVAANPNTVVVVNTGSPVALPWAGDVPAILQAWFGGQEMADAIVDIVTGDADPGGRLGTTFPLRLEHTPAFGNFPGENGEVRYGEGVLMGYRWYEARALPVRFPFGHGLSYTTFAIGAPALSSPTFTRGGTVRVDVDVTNTGTRRGSEIVQCYVAPATARLTRPPKELKGFAKVTLDPGASATVTIELDDRSFAYRDPCDPGRAELAARMSASPLASRVSADIIEPGWRVDAGAYALHIGRSSADIAHVVVVEVAE